MVVSSFLVGALVVLGLQVQVESYPNTIPIEVLHSTHEIHFPDEILFHLEAKGSSTITEVSLFYKLADLDIQIYAYPKFNPDYRINAEFALKTGGQSYIPSGVGIEYYYRIVDAEGNTLETEPVSMTYIDPRFNWQTLVVGDLRVIWHDIPEERVRSVAVQADNVLVDVKNLFNLDMVSPKKAIIVNNYAEARTVFPTISQRATEKHLFGGFAFTKFDLFVQSGLSLNTMVHETTHLMLNESISNHVSQIPAWLEEGIAMYFEPTKITSETIISKAKNEERLIPLRNMNSVPGIPADVGLFYAQSRSFVGFILDSYGTSRMTVLLEELRNGRDIDEAIQIGYAVSLGEIEGKWIESIGQASTKSSNNKYRIKTSSVLLAAAVVLAAIVSIFKWLVGLNLR